MVPSLVNWDGPIAMVPCLHQGNIYIKRNLRVWRNQKYNPLVGAITTLNCTGRHNTPSRVRQYSADNAKFRKLRGYPIDMGPCLHQSNIYIKRKLRVWREQKCSPLVRAITPLNCVSTKEIFTPKGSYGYGETRNVFR